VGLLEQLREESNEGGPLSLASVIRERRQLAEHLDPDQLLPSRPRRARTHRNPELLSLAYHRAVAHRLDEQVVRDARRRLERWRERGTIDPQCADEWELVLDMPLPKIATLISSDSKRARELRQSSPFAGVLTPQERRKLLRLVEDRGHA
jgi:hypothetical protein